MRISVKLFAILRERAGASELVLELPEQCSVASATEKIAAQIPAILRFAGVDAAAVEHAPGRHSPGGERSAIPAT